MYRFSNEKMNKSGFASVCAEAASVCSSAMSNGMYIIILGAIIVASFVVSIISLRLVVLAALGLIILGLRAPKTWREPDFSY